MISWLILHPTFGPSKDPQFCRKFSEVILRPIHPPPSQIFKTNRGLNLPESLWWSSLFLGSNTTPPPVLIFYRFFSYWIILLPGLLYFYLSSSWISFRGRNWQVYIALNLQYLQKRMPNESEQDSFRKMDIRQ